MHLAMSPLRDRMSQMLCPLPAALDARRSGSVVRRTRRYTHPCSPSSLFAPSEVLWCQVRISLGRPCRKLTVSVTATDGSPHSWTNLFSIQLLHRPNLCAHERWISRHQNTRQDECHLELGPCWAARSSYVGRSSPPFWSISGCGGIVKSGRSAMV